MRSKKSFPMDIADMHEKFNVHQWISDNPDKLEQLMRLRMVMLNEETTETFKAFLNKDKEEFVDGLIDIIVIAVGTLDIAGVDANKAWDMVHEANMSKEVGVKPGRPNPLGLPDLIKPDGWTGPDHSDNHGDLDLFL